MRFTALLVTLALILPVFGCSPDEPAPIDEEGALVIYSGRRDVLVDPLVERFHEATGIEVEVRYGNDAELLAAIQEEEDASPADIFWGNTAGALGAAASAGLLAQLPDSILSRPAAEFVPSSGLWMPASVRFRVMAYNPQVVTEDQLPVSVLDVPGMTDFNGRLGWTPGYSSFQDFVTTLMLTQGEDSTRAWLNGVKALEPNAYPSNTPMLEAMVAGEIDVALTNHYYVHRVLSRLDSTEAPSVAIHRFAAGDAGNLALVTGAGVLATSGRQTAAHRFLSFLLSQEAQEFVVATLFEYPVIESTPLGEEFMPFDEARSMGPEIDFEELRELERTLTLLREEELL